MRSLWLSTRAWRHSSRSASSIRDCSRLTKKTGRRSSTIDVPRTMFSAKAVFPTRGRAARMIELVVLEPGGQVVEVDEAGRDAAERIRVLPPDPLVDPVVASFSASWSVVVSAGHPLLGDVQDLPLGRLEQLVGRLRLVVGVAEDLVPAWIRLRTIALSRTILA